MIPIEGSAALLVRKDRSDLCHFSFLFELADVASFVTLLFTFFKKAFDTFGPLWRRLCALPVGNERTFAAVAMVIWSECSRQLQHPWFLWRSPRLSSAMIRFWCEVHKHSSGISTTCTSLICTFSLKNTGSDVYIHPHHASFFFQLYSSGLFSHCALQNCPVRSLVFSAQIWVFWRTFCLLRPSRNYRK